MTRPLIDVPQAPGFEPGSLQWQLWVLKPRRSIWLNDDTATRKSIARAIKAIRFCDPKRRYVTRSFSAFRRPIARDALNVIRIERAA